MSKKKKRQHRRPEPTFIGGGRWVMGVEVPQDRVDAILADIPDEYRDRPGGWTECPDCGRPGALLGPLPLMRQAIERARIELHFGGVDAWSWADREARQYYEGAPFVVVFCAGGCGYFGVHADAEFVAS